LVRVFTLLLFFRVEIGVRVRVRAKVSIRVKVRARGKIRNRARVRVKATVRVMIRPHPHGLQVRLHGLPQGFGPVADDADVDADEGVAWGAGDGERVPLRRSDLGHIDERVLAGPARGSGFGSICASVTAMASRYVVLAVPQSCRRWTALLERLAVQQSHRARNRHQQVTLFWHDG